MAAASTVQPVADANGAQVYNCDWRALASVVPAFDLLLVDAPYSERTHSGHDGKAEDVARGLDYRTRVAKPSGGTGPRRALGYKPWTVDDVNAFVAAWSPLTHGWFVTVTDHVLAPLWADALEAAGRYVFAPLAYVASGSRVRLLGDGPSNWTTWIVVARPRSAAFAKWGTLDGAYVLPPGHGGAMPVVGGKPIWLGCELVRAYSRPGDLVCDPCCGAGTFPVDAVREGRRAVGGDVLRAHADLAATWIANPWRPAPGVEKVDDKQPSLFERAGKVVAL